MQDCHLFSFAHKFTEVSWINYCLKYSPNDLDDILGSG